jgi:hypothetical protein
MADTLQSLGLLKPDFTALPPDVQDDPGAFVNLQAYVDALRRHDALTSGSDQPPIDFRQQAARVLQAYGDAQGQDGPSTPAPRNPTQPPATRPAVSPPARRHHVPQQLPDAFPDGVTGPLIRLSDPHFDARVREMAHNRPLAANAPVDRGGDSLPKAPEQPWYKRLAGMEPLLNKVVNGVPITQSLHDNYVGLLSGAASIPETAMSAIGWGLQHAAPAFEGDAFFNSATAKRSGQKLREWSAGLDSGIKSLAHDPDSAMFKSRDFLGSAAAAAAAPEMELSAGVPWLARAAAGAKAAKAVGRVAPWTTRMGAGLARYGDMAAQGGMFGALSSHGQNIAENAATSAALAPVLGVAVDQLMPALASTSDKAVSDLRYMLQRHTLSSSVDALIAGRGSGASKWADALRKHVANNRDAIEAELSRRADEATRAGPGRMTVIELRRPAATIDEARAAASQFVGEPITHPTSGATVTPTRRAVKKWTSGSSIYASDSPANHFVATANADDLYRNSAPIFDYRDPRGGPLTIGRSRAYFNTGDGIVAVKITSKKTPDPLDPNPLYNLETMPVEPVVRPETSGADIARLANVLNGVTTTAAGPGDENGGIAPSSPPPNASEDPGAGGNDQERVRAQQIVDELRRQSTSRGAAVPPGGSQQQRLQRPQPVSKGRSN